MAGYDSAPAGSPLFAKQLDASLERDVAALLSAGGMAAAVHRTATRMNVVLINTLDGTRAPQATAADGGGNSSISTFPSKVSLGGGSDSGAGGSDSGAGGSDIGGARESAAGSDQATAADGGGNSSINTFPSKVSLGGGSDSGAGGSDSGGARESAAGSDLFFCEKTLPVVTYLLCRCSRKALPEALPAARCGEFLGDALRFCVKLMDHVEELVAVAVRLLGGRPGPPPYLVGREAAMANTAAAVAVAGPSSSSSFHLAEVDPQDSFFCLHGVPLNVRVAGSTVWYWPDDPVDIERAARSLVGRDVKKRFRRYVNNGSGGWFSGVVESYDEETNMFLVAFEDGDRKMYNLDTNNVDIQVCPLYMCHDPEAQLSMSAQDEGKRIQVFHAKKRLWMGGWIEAYDEDDKAHVIRFDDNDDRSGGRSPHFEGSLVIVDFEEAVQYRLLKDAEQQEDAAATAAAAAETEQLEKKPEEDEDQATPSNFIVRPKAAANAPSLFLLANMEIFCRQSGYVKLFRYLKTHSTRVPSVPLSRLPSRRSLFAKMCDIVTCISASRNVLLPTERVLGRMSELLRETAFAYALSLSDDELRHASREKLRSGLLHPVRQMLEAAENRLSAREKRKRVRRQRRRRRRRAAAAAAAAARGPRQKRSRTRRNWQWWQ